MDTGFFVCTFSVRELEIELTFGSGSYKIAVEAVGYGALYDPENGKPRS
ncbi:hypothetical protein [Aliamphritea spongicola]|nr:hypothetical protein [Aliamphritea spongicola]MBN3564910.1 hypothetical protein [Aliamphritea spongicola]